MAISPNSTVQLYRGIPLDNTYQHTLYYASLSNQTSAFNNFNTGNYLVGTFEPMSYVRTNRGIKIATPISNVLTVNYMRFKNSSHGNKWFYAFVTEVNYINDNTTEIVFEIDVMQTWYISNPSMIGQCFVEREHTDSDNIGENLQPEPIKYGEYKSDFISNVIGDHQMYINVWASFNYNAGTSANNNVEVYSYNNPNNDNVDRYFVSGLYCNSFPVTSEGLAQFNEFIGHARSGIHPNANIDGIVSIVLAPSRGWATWSVAFNRPSAIDGYTPKNNKLFTYPYIGCYVTNLQGNTAVYPYEFFQATVSGNYYFEIYNTGLPNATCALVPLYYKGVTYNFDECLTIKGFQQVPINTDFFSRYCAQSLAQIPFNTAKIAASTAIGGPAIGAASAVGALFETAQNTAQAVMQPDQTVGSTANDGLALFGFTEMKIYNKHITAEYARIVDDFFTMYGYACNRVKSINNLGNRYGFHYVKTRGCTVKGNQAPADDVNKIAKIFDNGITFWRTIGNVGNYSINNGIVP